jgi:hypothetical protein
METHQKKTGLDELKELLSQHSRDPETTSAEQEISDFWNSKIEELISSLFFNNHHCRAQNLKRELKELKDATEPEPGTRAYEINEWRKVLGAHTPDEQKKHEVLRQIDSLMNRVFEGLASQGILMSHDQISCPEDHIDLRYETPQGAEEFARFLTETFKVDGLGRPSICLDTAFHSQVKETTRRLVKRQSDQCIDAVMGYLGKTFDAIYLCPAWAPSEIEPMNHGNWVYLDQLDLTRDGDFSYFHTNPNIRFVQHDLDDPDLPLPESSFDLVFYNFDYAGEGVTHQAAERLVKPEGIVMTASADDAIEATSLEKISSYKFIQYQLLSKP